MILKIIQNIFLSCHGHVIHLSKSCASCQKTWPPYCHDFMNVTIFSPWSWWPCFLSNHDIMSNFEVLNFLVLWVPGLRSQRISALISSYSELINNDHGYLSSDSALFIKWESVNSAVSQNFQGQKLALIFHGSRSACFVRVLDFFEIFWSISWEKFLILAHVGRKKWQLKL